MFAKGSGSFSMCLLSSPLDKLVWWGSPDLLGVTVLTGSRITSALSNLPRDIDPGNELLAAGSSPLSNEPWRARARLSA